ncbi:MAG: NAD(P)/FAD-dependent oxidoreductase [Alphaproteobacteria bacterium]|nr:NAD(P)/FAD-dependent oxidoreductase [Alphaproteobacteria bacterium]
MTLDCVIVGAGPAGLTAAVYLARFGLSACVIADGNSRADRIPLCRNFPGYPDGISGGDLLRRIDTQREKYGVPRVTGHVDAVTMEATGFSVRHGENIMHARAVILATGKTDAPPPRMAQAEHDAALREGRLHYCPICDAHEVRDRDVVLLGSGDHGMREAEFLCSYTNDVTLLCPDGPQARRSGIKAVDGPLIALSYRSGVLELTTAAAVLRPSHLYIALGCHQRSELAASLGASLSEDGCIVVDAHQRTSISGLYAIGDVVVGLDQIATAIGHAATAATAIRNDLCSSSTRSAASQP